MDEVLSDKPRDGTASARVIAAAIVIAGALIGLGAYLGLRQPSDRAPAEPPHASSSLGPRTATAPKVSATASAPPPPPAADSRAARQRRVAEDVSAQLAALRPALAERCWKPSVAQAADPPSATFQLRLVFRGNGELAHYGVGEAPHPQRADVVECLRAQKLDIVVKPPGDLVGTQQSLTLP